MKITIKCAAQFVALATVCIIGIGEMKATNPVFPGWYADPEGVIIDNNYWIYPTFSAGYDQQVYMDAFSSPDLVNWTKHSHVLDSAQIKWARRAMWAPSIIKKQDKYYLFFSANDIQTDGASGGIGVGVSDKPEGPFLDYLGKPLLNRIVNGAQPIDQFVFQDVDGSYYMIYGGWKHCNIVRLQNDFKTIIPFPDGTTYKEITSTDYVEGPVMFRRNNKYYFMWSEGGWTGPDYRVAYAIGDSPFGPFNRIGLILQQNSAIATGAGHHSVINIPGTDDWYIVYHRRPLSETDGNSRATCVDKMIFDKNGYIQPVVMTFQGVSPRFIDGPVTAFKNCSFTGDSIKLGKGKYTKADLLSLGFADGDLSGIRIKNGLEAVLFDGDNFTGNSIVVSGNVDCLSSRSFDNITTSLIIRRSGETNLAGTYYIQNNASGLFLGVTANSRKESSKLEINNGSYTQQFELQRLHENIYSIKVVNSAKSLQIERASLYSGSPLEQATMDTTLQNQQFVIQAVGDGNYKIYNNHSDLPLEATGITVGSGVYQSVDSEQSTICWKLLKQSDVAFVEQEDCSGRIAGGAYYDDCQKCVGGNTGVLPCTDVIVKAYDGCGYSALGIGLKAGEYKLSDFADRLFVANSLSAVNVKTGYVAELYDEDNFTGTPVIVDAQDSCLIDNNFDNKMQSMIVRRKGETNLEGTYCLQNKQSGLYMRVQSDSQTPGANIVQTAYLGKTSQQFQLKYVGGGYYNLVGVASNQTLSVARSSTTSGAFIQQWDNTNADITNIGGIITAQYTDSPTGEGIANLIDNQASTKFLTGHNPAWVQFKVLGTAVVTSYSITSANDAPERDPLNWTLQGSNDGVSWQTIDSQNGIDFPSRFQTLKFNCTNSVAYSLYRFNITNNSGVNIQMSEIELFGASAGTGGYDNQKFIIQTTGAGYYKIFNKNSNLLIDILGNSSGYNILQKADVGQQSGLWKLVSPDSFSDVDSPDRDLEIHVYPNPVIDKINVMGLDKSANFEIYDAMGVLVKVGSGKSVAAADLRSGIYFLRLQLDNQTQNITFVKK